MAACASNLTPPFVSVSAVVAPGGPCVERLAGATSVAAQSATASTRLSAPTEPICAATPTRTPQEVVA
ncbi:hypothetical protein GCM10027200_29970 [Lentzea nigeriaca]